MNFQKNLKKGEFETAKNELYSNLGVIEQYFTNFSSSKKSRDLSTSNYSFKAFTFQQISDSDIINYSKKSENYPDDHGQDEIRLIEYLRSEPKEPWDVPIQYNESTFLYYFFYSIAKAVDVVTPGKRKTPWLNIRFLASPFYFVLLFLIVLVLKFIL